MQPSPRGPTFKADSTKLASQGGRPVFAHLKLGEAYAAADVFDDTPAVRALACGAGTPAAWRAAIALLANDCTNSVGAEVARRQPSAGGD